MVESLAHFSGIDQQLAAMYQRYLTRHVHRALGSILVCLLALMTLASVPSAFAASKDRKGQGGTQGEQERKEQAAMTACLSGDVQAGVALLAELYVSYKKSTYLFNQGRCFQQNGRYADAIVRFREYQRKIRIIGEAPDEDADGHIKECQALLNGERTAASPGAATTNSPPAPLPKFVTQPSVGDDPSNPGRSPNLQPALSPTPAGARIKMPDDLPETQVDPSPPLYKRTWFWVVTSTVIATAVVLWASGTFKTNNCPAGYDCPTPLPK